MEDGGLDSSPSVSDIEYGEWLDECCAYYMTIGVPVKEFWFGDYTMLKYYVKAHELRAEQSNQEMWWQGYYDFIAYSTALSNLNFSGKKHKPNEYIKEPIRITPLSEEEKQAKAQEARKHMVNELNAWAKAWERKENGGRTND